MPMFYSTYLISAQPEQIKKNDHLRSRLDSISSFIMAMFYSTYLISAQSEQIKKIIISDLA